MKKNQPEKIDFPTTEHYTETDIKNVQIRLMKMAVTVRDILDAHKIPYFICYGTLLGAVRHGGFIPWDDDFDFFLFDESYDKGMEVLREELSDNLLVHDQLNDPLYFKAWSSVRDVSTEVDDAGLYHPDNERLAFQCLALDLYRLKRMSRQLVPLYKIDEAIDFYQRKRDRGLLGEEEYDKLVETLQKNRNMVLGDLNGRKDLAEVFAFMVGFREPLNIDDILPLKPITFEGVSFLGPANPDAVLKSSYGNYMNLPEYSQRRSHYKRVIFK
jgi:lipopolysaccharide cholinephosphotransferase